MKGDVNDNLCVLPVSFYFKASPVVSIVRHKMSIHTNKSKKHKLGIQKDKYSIDLERLKEKITKVRKKHNKRLVLTKKKHNKQRKK